MIDYKIKITWITSKSSIIFHCLSRLSQWDDVTLKPLTRDKLGPHIIDKWTEATDLLVMSTNDYKLMKVVSFIVNQLGHVSLRNLVHQVTSVVGSTL